MLPFDINYEEFSHGTPIKFKHDPESREELKKIRTQDELLGIIEEYHLQDFMINATLFNDKKFCHADVVGHIELDDGKYTVVFEGVDPIEMSAIDDNDYLQELISDKPLELIDVLMYRIGDDSKIFLMIFDSEEEKIEFWDDDTKSTIPFLTTFMEATEIDTLHKLGKVINKGVEISERYSSLNM